MRKYYIIVSVKNNWRKWKLQQPNVLLPRHTFISIHISYNKLRMFISANSTRIAILL